MGYQMYQSQNPNQSSGSTTGSPCDGTCFVAGTLIETKDGSLPIEQIKVGMLVYATNPETGETTLKEVVNAFVRETTQLIHIEVNGESITTTPTHPFWVPLKGLDRCYRTSSRRQTSTSQWRICHHRTSAT